MIRWWDGGWEFLRFRALQQVVFHAVPQEFPTVRNTKDVEDRETVSPLETPGYRGRCLGH